MKLDYFFKKQNDLKEHFLKWEELEKRYMLHAVDLEGVIGFCSLGPSFIAWICSMIFAPSFIHGGVGYSIWAIVTGAICLTTANFIWNKLTEKTNSLLRFFARDNTTQYLESKRVIFEHINNENWQLEFIQQTTIFINEARKIQLKHSDMVDLLDNIERLLKVLKSHFVEGSAESIKAIKKVYEYYNEVMTLIAKEEKLNMFDIKLASMEKTEYREYLEMQIGELQTKLRASI